ncbi:transferrin receptor protein 1-like isoform 1-T2 [Clarias gariepinus]|uniref:transferrin receptor protein 1-like n=1 Tax=Clarias gariepinus TaxID=13013 RepID=UPI00234D896D|nr:transferrin receptor protein 1-like [Clarias gariepinus]XP_053342239.1 transferrin receptor protein 1-like [Clarias gariepinus]
MEDNSSQLDLIMSDLDEVPEQDIAEESLMNHVHTSLIGSIRNTLKNICFALTAALFIFAFGSLIGYVAHTKRDAPSCKESTSDGSDVTVQTEPILDWSNITSLFKNKLNTSSIENSLNEFFTTSHQAGSPGDEELSSKVWKKFTNFGMTPWTDSHFVRIHDRPTKGFNTVMFRNKTFSEQGYLAYSPTGTAKGAVLYAHYGQRGDFKSLQDLNISSEGKIVLIRAGKISFAEKVANAASVNASAVLIYPDPADYLFDEETDLFGHVHLGSGDPFTPGYPSFNHTQFPPAKSSGLPSIPAQTIKASTAAAIMKKMGGHNPPPEWASGGLREVTYKLGGDDDIVFVDVDNALTMTKIFNMFGVVKGFIDPDRYVVIGAQRDAWGPGFAKSTIGTSLLLELARVITEMMRNDGFKPRRSMVFASWTAGEYGAVGATEWLEGYLSSLNIKAFSYISLDGVVTGSSFKASASPLMYDLIESTLKEVASPSDPSKSLYSQMPGTNWEMAVMEPMRMDDPAYPFQAFSGIPAVSFQFTENKQYPFFGTMLDTRGNLENKTSTKLLVVAKAAGEIAGVMALRLVHDHLLRLNVEKYKSVIGIHVTKIHKEVMRLQKSGHLTEPLQTQCLMSALGSYRRASSRVITSMENSDLYDLEQCRFINDQIMGVERNLLFPYVSPRDTPFRHILLGSGSHTLEALCTHLASIQNATESVDAIRLNNRIAIAAWTIQSCASAVSGNMWDTEEQLD